MKKAHLGAVLIFCILAISGGCIQAGEQAAPGTGKASSDFFTFSMSGIGVKLPVPDGYVETNGVLRQSLPGAFTPPENIFAVFSPRQDKAATGSVGLRQLQNRKLFVVSARPEFQKEFVDQSLFMALRRDVERNNGAFGPERLQQFRVLTQNYYASDDSFLHSLGIYHSDRFSLSAVRIGRLPGSLGQGAASAYASAQSQSEYAPVLGNWPESYFSRAYHYVSIQNVLCMNGRYFNIYFFAPMELEADIYAAMLENAEYMEAISQAAALGQLNIRGNTRPGTGPETVEAQPERNPDAIANQPQS